MRDKKHVFKRGLSLFLALTMCLSLLQVTAFAEWEPEWDRLKHTYSADCQRCLHAAGDTYHTIEWKGTTTRYCGCCGRIWVPVDGYAGDNFICKKDSSMHLWVEGTPLEPTCTEAGHSAGEVCRYCGTMQNQASIPATGHKYDKYEATVTGETHSATCIECGATVTQEHTYKLNEADSETAGPACSAKKYVYECELCNHRKTDIKGISHTPDPTEWVTVDVDHHSRPCLYCGKPVGYQTWHTWKSTETTLPTCTQDGVTAYECSGCTATKEVTTPALDHKYGEYEAIGTGEKHWVICSVCGDKQGTEEHEFVDGVCVKCGATESSEPIAEYTVTYYRTTDRNHPVETIEVKQGSSFVVADAPESAPAGMVFDCWIEGTSTKHVPGTEITPNKDMELFASWKDAPEPDPETWTVTYMDDEREIDVVKVVKGDSTKAPAAPDAPEGKEFNGWWKGTTPYQPGDSFTPDGDWILKAGWKTIETETPAPETYTITYQCGGFSREVKLKEGGETIVLEAFDVPAGKEFKGWSCGDDIYQPGDKLTPTGDMTLTAVLEDKVTLPESVTYTLKYDANGEGVTGMPEEQTVIIAEDSHTFTVAAAPVREGYTFKHWATTAAPVGTTLTYAAGAEITLTEGHKAQTLYAVWEENVHEHSFGEYVYNNDATCVMDGTETATCSCGEKDTRTAEGSAKGHTVVVDAAVAPTCTEAGLTEGSHCSACGEVLAKQEVVAAAGHQYDDGVTVTVPDCNHAGATRFTCEVCGDSYEEADSPFGHEVVSYASVAATCTANGYTGGSYCSRCGSVITARTVVPAVGHSWNAGVVTTQPTYYNTGVRTYTCARDASHTYTETIPALTYPGGGGGGYNPVTPVTPVTPNVPVTPNNPVNIPDANVPQGSTPDGLTTIEDENTPLGGITFVDVTPTDWFYDAVQYVFEKGLMLGVSDTEFGPNLSTTRGMIVTILYRMEGEPEAAAAPFTDVEPGLWYSDAIGWGAANDIVNGYGDGRFGPNDQITREQMAAIFYRYAQYKGYDVTARADLSGYADADQISEYAVEAMQWAVGVKLVNGLTADTLVPKGQATRAQVATMLMRFDQEIAAA